MNLSAKEKTAVAVIGINHLIGAIGLNISFTASLFESLSWLNLLVTFLLLMWASKQPKNSLLIFGLVSFSAGMLVEIAGVNTGQLFGVYHYTAVLGFAVWGVPVIIGINWVLLAYSAANATSIKINNYWLQVFAGATLMVAVDLLLEGFAIRHHLWVWQNTTPPLQNFVAWWLVAVVMQMAYGKLLRGAGSWLPAYYIVVLFAFLLTDILLFNLLSRT